MLATFSCDLSVAWVAQESGRPAIFFGVDGLIGGAGSEVSDVTVFTGPGMGLVGSISTNISLKHFNILLRPGSGRMMSTTADATHFSGCKGTIALEDCIFEGMGDEGINVGVAGRGETGIHVGCGGILAHLVEKRDGNAGV